MTAEAAYGESGGPGDKPEAVTTEQVLLDEYRLIWPAKPQPVGTQDYYRRVQENDQAALCLSGGGIRSASFALGILQALSRKELLTRFHYLSTVSGGGYIGGWLQRWISVHPRGPQGVMEEIGASCRSELVGKPGDGAPPLEPEPIREPRQIRALRENSNFITPRVGLGSNDTWTAISISVRNISVNWLLFAPLFLLVAVLPNLFADTLEWLATAVQPVSDAAALRATEFGYLPFALSLLFPDTELRVAGLIYLPFALSLVFAAIAAWNTCRALPSYRRTEFDVMGAGDGWLLRKICIPLVAWALFGALAIWPDQQQKLLAESWSIDQVLAGFEWARIWDWRSWLSTCLGFAALSLVVAFASLALSGATLPPDKKRPERDFRRTFRKDLGLWLVAFLVAAVTILVGCELFRQLPFSLVKAENASLLAFAWLAPLWLMASQLMIAFVFAAFRRHSGDEVSADSDREWLARLSAVKFKQMLAWAVLAFATLILYHLLDVFRGHLSLTGLIATLSGATAIFGGRAQGSGHTTSAAATSVLRFLPLQSIIAIATFIFAITLLTLFSVYEHLIAGGLVPYLSAMFDTASTSINASLERASISKPFDKILLAHLIVGAIALIVLLLLDKRIPVNRFSLSGLYRNRLNRAFLGGARTDREADPFTGFDAGDNIDLCRLANADGKRKGVYPEGAVLYPVVNVALNVTSGTNLAWQERKASPFILSPLYCGSDTLLRENSDRETEDTGAYISAHSYGGSEPEQKDPVGGISLATAISISGAAASPNMGYHGSPATAFLMTLFNLRLGQWMPNPARAKTLGKKVFRSNPTSSMRALLRELGGSTDDQGLDIYLSDGGHFENLGLYEMVRRRCRYIVVSDAGCDPDCDFADLGGAVRKSLIDLGADIRFRPVRISSRGKPIEGQVAWAIGDICYGDGQIGQLLYIKPSYFEANLPLDVVSYAAASQAFPHESTGDQFFSESQFESYRKLGFTFGTTIVGEGPHPDLADFFAKVGAIGQHEDPADQKLKAGLRTWLRGLLR